MKQLPLIQINPVNGDRYYVNEYKPSLKYASALRADLFIETSIESYKEILLER